MFSRRFLSTAVCVFKLRLHCNLSMGAREGGQEAKTLPLPSCANIFIFNAILPFRILNDSFML